MFEEFAGLFSSSIMSIFGRLLEIGAKIPAEIKEIFLRWFP